MQNINVKTLRKYIFYSTEIINYGSVCAKIFEWIATIFFLFDIVHQFIASQPATQRYRKELKMIVKSTLRSKCDGTNSMRILIDIYPQSIAKSTYRLIFLKWNLAKWIYRSEAKPWRTITWKRDFSFWAQVMPLSTLFTNDV